jgi:hypothetical protein
MKYIALLLFFCFSASFISGQNITGPELLQKSIDYHDPNTNWQKLDTKFSIVSSTPERKDRIRSVYLNNVKGHFTMHSNSDPSVFYSVSPATVSIELDGSSDISEEEANKYRANIKGAKMFRDYISYLYGLPMKLKDPGTIIHAEVIDTVFYTIPSLRLKVSYEAEVGGDTWYFYFDKMDYSLKAYQFFHDESKNDGEYILLEGEETVQGIKMPKVRKWYYNSDGKYLGTDTLKASDE